MVKYLKTATLMIALGTGSCVMANERAVIVFDGSGSMWGQIDGKPKHELARTALRELLDHTPETMELGLMAYGHREKGSCTDIEMLVDPGPGTKPAILKAVDQMRFLGKTPLSAAVQQAAQALRYSEEKATVILITDGEETCQADPCALGTALKKNGVNFTAHVIGFGLSKQQGEQVSCLAHNTGGQYFEANNAAHLSQALDATLQAMQNDTPTAAVSAPPALPPPAPEKALATLNAPEAASAGTVIQIDWSGPNESGDYITIVTPQTPDSEYGAYGRTSDGTPVKVQTPDAVGTHEIRYVRSTGRQVLARAAIELIPLEASVSGPEQAHSGGTIQVQWTGPDSPGDYLTVVESGAPKGEYTHYARSSSGSPASLQVPDGLGNYEIRYVLGNSKRTLAAQPIVLNAVSASLQLLNTPVIGGKATVQWTGPDNRDDYITVVPKGAPNKKYTHVARTSSGSPSALKMPDAPGDYEVRYIMGSSKRVLSSLAISLSESQGQISTPEWVTVGSTIEVQWTGPGNREDFIEIIPSDASEHATPIAATRVTQGNPLSIHAPAVPGTYQVRYMMRDIKKVLAIKQIEVRPLQ